jgi:phosphotransferase system HPr (HPr) family protein
MTHADDYEANKTSSTHQDESILFTEVLINHPLGLHLRKGKDVVQVANRFQACITAQNLTLASAEVDAKSILQLMQIQARQGHTVRLAAAGPDAPAALSALSALFDQRHYDVPTVP